jgi:23S rRNA (uracil1939-C5)-methyltransferase
VAARRSRPAETLLGPPEIIEAELTGVDPDGAATGVVVGDGPDREEVSAAFGLPGERVAMEVWERRDGCVAGRVLRVLRPSPERVEPPCPYFGACGGCQWQHAPYERQLAYKRDKVAVRLAGAGFDDIGVEPTLPAPSTYGYRNHARFSIGRKFGELGYTTYHAHRFFRVDECPIAHPRINDILKATQRRAAGHQLAVRVGARTGDLLVNPPQQDDDLPYKSGQTYLEEELLGRRFRVSAAAFFQVNTEQAERLIGVTRDLLSLRETDVLLDLYCGVGTFGLALAPLARRVIGVEESAAALKDAHYNARDLANVEFLAGRTEDVLASLDERVDAAIVDPPRIGCRPGALEALVRLAPRRLAYVSCDPASLARDLRVLVDGGFALRTVQPVDMFPQTAHVETVALLTYADKV